MEVEYGNELVELDEWLIERLSAMEIEVDECYLDSLSESSDPLLTTPVEQLVREDVFNRMLYDAANGGLGRIIAYVDGLRFYDCLYDAIAENWGRRPAFGFEVLHSEGITPSERTIERFGVRSRVPCKDLRLRELNDLSKTIYRLKDGVKWRKTYEENAANMRLEKLSLDEYLHRKARSFSFSLGWAIAYTMRCARKEDSEIAQRDEQAYRDALNQLFKRYATKDGTTAFETVTDLNAYDGHTGVYVLGFDAEKRYYVGQTGTSLMTRVMHHFRSPSSSFDRTHTFEELCSIHFIHVHDKWHYGRRDEVETDCIATLGPEFVCNSLAATQEWTTRKLRLIHAAQALYPDSEALKWATRYHTDPRTGSVRSERYDPRIFQMTESEVRSIVDSVEFSRWCDLNDITNRKQEAAARKLRETRRQPPTPELCMLAVQHDGVSLEFVPLRLRSPELCEAAVQRDGVALKFVPTKLRSPDLCLQAIGAVDDPAKAYESIPPEFVDEEFALRLVAKNRRVTKCLPKTIKTDRVMRAAGYRRKRRE